MGDGNRTGTVNASGGDFVERIRRGGEEVGKRQYLTKQNPNIPLGEEKKKQTVGSTTTEDRAAQVS